MEVVVVVVVTKMYSTVGDIKIRIAKVYVSNELCVESLFIIIYAYLTFLHHVVNLLIVKQAT